MIRLLLPILLLLLLLPGATRAESAAPLREFARQHVLQRLQEEGFREVEVQPVGGEQIAALPDYATLVARPLRGRWPRETLALTVDLLDADQQRIASHTLWLNIDIPVTAQRYRRALRPGHSLVAEDLQSARVNRAALSADPAAADELLGQRLRRAVRAGEAALALQVESAPDVDRHARVMLTAGHGAVQLRTPATALQSGRIGEVIAVRVSDDAPTLRARIDSATSVLLVQ